MKRLILLLLCPSLVATELWNAQTYPNPTAGQFQKCGMRTHAKICDPDGVLDEASRSRLDYELSQLETRTRQENARSFCEKKGITPAMALAKRIQGGTEEDIKAMANSMLEQWTLDSQCQKAIVYVVSIDDANFWTARNDKVPVYSNEFRALFMQQRDLFKRKQYVDALKGLIQGTWEKALSKQGSPSLPSGSGRQDPGQRPSQGFGDATGGRSSPGGSGPKLPDFKIPGWFWMALIFGVIPLLCCCCCLYCCCCRGKGDSGGGGRQPVPQDIPGNGGGGGGGGRGPFGNFLSTLSGAGVGSMIGNFLSSRNRGGGGMGGGGMGMSGMGGYGDGGGDYQGGGAYPAEPRPVYDDNDGQGGKGLYPSVSVKDEGGGGSWA